MVIYMMFIIQMKTEKRNVYVILDTKKEMQKDCLILKNVLVRK